MPLETSQSLIVLSCPDDAIRVPSGLNATESARPSCPCKTASSSQLSVSQSRTVLSNDADAIRDPSGLNATEWTGSS